MALLVTYVVCGRQGVDRCLSVPEFQDFHCLIKMHFFIHKIWEVTTIKKI